MVKYRKLKLFSKLNSMNTNNHIYKVLCLNILIWIVGLGGCAVKYNYLTVYDFIEVGQLNRDDNSKLNYFIWDRRPDIRDKPIYFIIHGSECSSFVANYKSVSAFSLKGYMNFPEDYVVAACEKRGIITGYYGKGFHGCGSVTKEYLAHESLIEQAYDYFQLINFLKSKTEYLDSKVILDGSSDGVIVVSKLLKLMHYNADAVILTSGQYISVEELLKLNKCKGMNRHEFEIIENNSDRHRLKRILHGHTYKYWKEKLDYRPIDDLVKFNRPIYLFHGQLDHPELTNRMMETFNSLNKKNLRITIYPNANHQLFDIKNKKSYSKDRYKKIFEWLNCVL